MDGPDRMVLNAKHIVLIEPVSPDSKVAPLIAESKKERAADRPVCRLVLI